MRVASIALRDFRSYANAEIAFDEPLNIICGHNHSGKSSIAQALQLSLSKRADGTDPRGAGATDKIRNGAAKAIIDVRVVGKAGTVDLKTTYGPNKTGRNQTITVRDSDNPKIAQGFNDYLDREVDRFACVLDADYFTSSTKADQKAILASLVLPTTYKFPDGMVSLVQKRLGSFDWSKPPVSIIDQIYKVAYDTRKEAKAALNAIHVPADPRVPDYSVATVQEQLQKLRSEASKLAKNKPSGTVRIGRLEQQLATLQGQQATLAQTIANLEEQVSSARSQMLDSNVLKKYQRVAAGRDQYTALETQIEETVREIQAQRDAQSIYEDLLESPFCPTCTQSITKEFIDSKVAVHKQLENEATELQMSFFDQQKALGDISGAESALRQHTALEEKKRNLMAQVADAKTRAAELAIEIQSAEVALADAQKAQPEAEDTTAIDALNAEITTWEARLAPAVQYVSTVNTIKDAMERKQAKQAEVNDLEILCSYFGKDGIKAELIGEHVGSFTATVNRVLKVWGYQASLSIEPYEFLVNSKNGTLPLKELSGSERLMFAVALQCAIAVHSKIRMVVIDRGDTFINGERNRLFGGLMTLLKDETLEQAIVLLSDDAVEAPKKPGAAFYRVADGKVVRL